MDKFGRKLNNIWEELTSLNKTFRAGLRGFRKEIRESREQSHADTEELKRALVDIIRSQTKSTSKVEGEVNIPHLYDDLARYFKRHQLNVKAEGDFYPELQKIAGDVNIANHDELATHFATKLAELLPEPQKFPDEVKAVLTQEKMEVWGDVRILAAKAGASDYMPVRLSDGKGFINVEKLLKDIAEAAASGAVAVGGGGAPHMYGKAADGKWYPVSVAAIDGEASNGYALVVVDKDGNAISAGTATDASEIAFTDGTVMSFTDDTDMAFTDA